MAGTPRPETISTKLQRVATLARQMPDRPLTTLAHHLDMEWMKEAWRRTRKDGATGVDGQTAEEYAQNLEENLSQLLDRVKSGTYRAPPVRRTYIPKADGRLRPLGIPTIEDKVVQRAVLMLTEPVFEAVFRDSSFGFRPRRSQHQAVETLLRHAWDVQGGWVLEVDVRAFFDRVDHRILQDFVRQRVGDGVILRLIGKWLNAGVMEDGALQRSELGTPQGGVISPLLANIYLHYVVDAWFEDEVVRRLGGRARLVRYADDFVMVFERENDARRVLEVLPKRLGRYGLEVSPEKTRLVDFRRPRAARPPVSAEGSDSHSFDFLGFTYYWGLSRKGRKVVRLKTAKKRIARILKAFGEHCRTTRHDPVTKQHATLSLKLRGHYQYFGVTMNMRALQQVYHRVRQIWRYWLDRRSQKARMTWDRFVKLTTTLRLPGPKIVHKAAIA